jgi:hypothetical protein
MKTAKTLRTLRNIRPVAEEERLVGTFGFALAMSEPAFWRRRNQATRRHLKKWVLG